MNENLKLFCLLYEKEAVVQTPQSENVRKYILTDCCERSRIINGLVKNNNYDKERGTQK